MSPGAVKVQLPEAPTTGYLWALEDLPHGVTLVRTEYQAPGTGTIGGQGERAFVLDVLSVGRHVLEFRLARAPGDEAVENRTVTLIVAPGE
ncbi:MAG: Chagasin family peptidase inhibitor [Actinomycetota bacterium]|nr:Chagasin family peptidase inhibitor [Actinomycetota bacterium]